jgi:hypothetical protein
MKKIAVLVGLLCWCDVLGFSQDQAQTQPSVININISVSRTVQAVSYPNNTSSSINFTGTPLLPFAKGQAKVENKKGVITIQAELQKNVPSQYFRGGVSDIRALGYHSRRPRA